MLDYVVRISARCSSQVCVYLFKYNQAPNVAPEVLVIRSVVPDMRVGMNACNTSIVKLTQKPATIADSRFRLRPMTHANKAAKQNPSGTRPKI